MSSGSPFTLYKLGCPTFSFGNSRGRCRLASARGSFCMLHWTHAGLMQRRVGGMAGGTFWLQADVSNNGKGTGSLLSHCSHGPGTDAQPLHPCHMMSHLSGGSQGWASSYCKEVGSSADLCHLLPQGSGWGIRLNPQVLLSSWAREQLCHKTSPVCVSITLLQHRRKRRGL